MASRERGIMEFKTNTRRLNQHMGFGKRDQREDRVQETVGQEIKRFGDSLDKEEERVLCV